MRQTSLLDGHLVPAPKVSDLERVDCILSMVENMLKRRFIECENGEQLKGHETLVHFEGQCYANTLCLTPSKES